VAAIVEPGRVALDIPEILESALSFLPPRTLFGVQRVSHLWKSTIAASPPIQEKTFLRLRTKTSEIWMLKNPRSVPRGWNRGEERPGLDWNFRIVGDTEMQSGSWKIKSGELQHLLTLVTLSPFLHIMQYGSANDRIEENSHAFQARLVPTAKFAQHNSFRNTYLTDPPCKEVGLYMNYEARLSPPELHTIGGYAEIRSDKPLTLGDIIDQTLASPDTWLRLRPSPETPFHSSHNNSSFRRSGMTLTQHIEELEKRHNCSIVLEDQEGYGFVLRLSLRETILRPLLLTDANYLRFKPTEQPSQ
jgi:hypothetical protein